jgi:hypothetical protein
MFGRFAGLFVLASDAFSTRMVRHIEKVVIKDGGRNRRVRVTIDAPNPEALDIWHLAQKTWLRPTKELKIGNVTVSVKAFRRR